MKKTLLIALLAALTFCACSTDSMNTYWRNNKTGEWVIGITENNLVYDSKVWDITSKTEADDAYTIEARCGQETISVSLGKENADKRIITVNGTETECSLIDDEYLPDYPETDTTPLANNNYVEGDSVTIKGWIMPEPSFISWLREKRNNYAGAKGEVSARIQSIYTKAEKTYNAPIDSLGRFTLRIPLENTTFFYLNYGHGYARMVAEPNETYFLMVDPMQRKTLFMGRNARLQNELNAHFLELKTLSCLDVEDEIKELDKLRDSVAVLKETNLSLLDKTVKEHPSLSEKYKTFTRNRILGEMADVLMIGEFLNQNITLPESYLKDIEEHYWSQMDQLCVLMPDDHEHFPLYYWWNLRRIASTKVEYKLSQVMEGAEREGIISLTAKDREAIRQYDQALPAYCKKRDETPDSLRDALYEEFKKNDFMTVISDITSRKGYMEYATSRAQVRNFKTTLAAMQARGWSQTAQDIYLCRELCSTIDCNCGPLDKYTMDFADATIQLPAARNVLYAVTEKWKNIGKEKKLNANMSKGEKILRKLCEPYKGRPILMDIWGTWCGPCKAALSHCQEEYEQMKDYDLVYMYLAWNSKEEDCKKVIEQYNITGPNVVHHILTAEEQKALESYLGIHSWPFYRLIDRNSNLIDVELNSDDTEKLKKLLDKLK